MRLESLILTLLLFSRCAELCIGPVAFLNQCVAVNDYTVVFFKISDLLQRLLLKRHFIFALGGFLGRFLNWLGCNILSLRWVLSVDGALLLSSCLDNHWCNRIHHVLFFEGCR